MKNYIGSWNLYGYKIIYKQLVEETTTLRKDKVKNWLLEEATFLDQDIKLVSGSRLIIKNNGFFEEESKERIKFHWYDDEGILQQYISPFSGNYYHHDSRLYLFSNKKLGNWQKSKEEWAKMKVRYDDGDTKICDFLKLNDNYLVRTVNAITDELYFDRLSILYKRVD